jgi:hypothetical protein
MLLDSCGFEPALPWTQDELLVAGGDVVQRPVGGESAEAGSRLATEGGGRQTGQGPKSGAKRPQALIAHVEANVRDVAILCQQQLLGFVNAHPGGKFVRRLAKRLREQAVEMKRRKTGLSSRVLQGDAIVEAGADIIARPAQPSKRDGIEEPRTALCG